ncbi:MAG: HipA N-terminal domain-containing protein [Bacteroidales bacterium]|nr:HipA N-terminal domain-containing protein [Bacteroidales bacterium]
MRQLGVYNNDILAGVLTEQVPAGGYVFTYDPAYLSSGCAPVSVTLPLQSASYESESLFPFFVNLLPEGANRTIICRKYRVDEEDLFGLLTVMSGQDFIGAVSVRPL